MQFKFYHELEWECLHGNPYWIEVLLYEIESSIPFNQIRWSKREPIVLVTGLEDYPWYVPDVYADWIGSLHNSLMDD